MQTGNILQLFAEHMSRGTFFFFQPYLLRTLVTLRVLVLSIQILARIHGIVNAQGTAGSEIEKYQLLNGPKKWPHPNSKHLIVRWGLSWAGWKFYMFTVDDIERCSPRHIGLVGVQSMDRVQWVILGVLGLHTQLWGLQATKPLAQILYFLQYTISKMHIKFLRPETRPILWLTHHRPIFACWWRHSFSWSRCSPWTHKRCRIMVFEHF